MQPPPLLLIASGGGGTGNGGGTPAAAALLEAKKSPWPLPSPPAAVLIASGKVEEQETAEERPQLFPRE